MCIYKIWRRPLLLTCFIIILLTSCAHSNQNDLFLYHNLQSDNGINEVSAGDIENEDSPTTKEDIDEMAICYSMGIKIKELYNVPGIYDPVILVNDEAISKGQVESKKIQIDTKKKIIKSQTFKDQTAEFKKSISDLRNPRLQLKKEIISMVRDKVVQKEAIRKKLQPTQDKIDNYLEEQRKLLELDVIGASYKKGLATTEEDDEKIAYNILQRSALYKSIIISQEKKFQSEEEKRKVALSVVQEEYWQRYIDKLVKKAKIEILDPELKELFGI